MSKRSKRVKRAMKRECNKNVLCEDCKLFSFDYEDILCNPDNYGSKVNKIKKLLNMR